ncbi:MAG TPA: beta-N-acetylhexosaminidase [Verrucomicrobiae bacterium]
MKHNTPLLSLCWNVALAVPLLTISGLAVPGESPSLVPRPQKIEQFDGTFVLGPKTRIVADKAGAATGEYLAERLRKTTGFPVPVRTQANARKPARNSILLTTSQSWPVMSAEGYQLEVAPRSVVIRASSDAGLFYGVQSLLQLLPPEALAPGAAGKVPPTVPCVRIEDAPRFPYRGALLDVARHFFTKDELKRYVDELAFHKINTLQLHLTDDQGWRIEIKKYPRLTEIGAWRKSIGFNLDPKSSRTYGADGRYGGFYTQAEMREIIAYARSRHITILPELEMPGHAGAALAAYPQLSCLGGPYSTDTPAGSPPAVYCPGNEETFTFIRDVLGEISQLFPGPYVHIGGDEVNKDNWHNCARCQARMRQENLKTEHELQSYFVRRAEKILNANAKRLIGWSEIREGGLAQNATVMDWIGGAVEAATAGHDVIMTPTTHCYLDYYQSRNTTNEPVAIGGFIPLQMVYSFEPVPAALEPKYRPRILGAQGNVWTEFIASLQHVEYMTFPRLCALAEVTWSPQATRNWDDFVRRLQIHTRRLDALGIHYRQGFSEK